MKIKPDQVKIVNYATTLIENTYTTREYDKLHSTIYDLPKCELTLIGIINSFGPIICKYDIKNARKIL